MSEVLRDDDIEEKESKTKTKPKTKTKNNLKIPLVTTSDILFHKMRTSPRNTVTL